MEKKKLLASVLSLLIILSPTTVFSNDEEKKKEDSCAPYVKHLGPIPENQVLDKFSSSEKITINYYNAKTASILRKYGPGPRVHFHIGYFQGKPNIDTNLEKLQLNLVNSQEAMMKHAAKIWEAPKTLSGNVLDAGCGLGGGAIYWAKEHGAHVTAVTIAAEHIPLISDFSEQAQVSDRIQPLLSDVCDVPIDRQYDAVVAMESACYFPRDRWFLYLSKLIKPNGYVCIEDTFLGRVEWQKPFDAYWKTQVAPVKEYIKAAQNAGFTLDQNEDITDNTTEFWAQSLAWTKAFLNIGEHSVEEKKRLEHSIHWHSNFSRAWHERGIEVRLLRFRREPSNCGGNSLRIFQSQRHLKAGAKLIRACNFLAKIH